MREIGTIPEGEGKMYKGVGKMYAFLILHPIIFCVPARSINGADLDRFIQQTRSTVDASHLAQEKALNEEIGGLSKKVRPPLPAGLDLSKGLVLIEEGLTDESL